MFVLGHSTKYVGEGAEMRALLFYLGGPSSTPYSTTYVDLNFQSRILAIMRNSFQSVVQIHEFHAFTSYIWICGLILLVPTAERDSLCFICFSYSDEDFFPYINQLSLRLHWDF